MAQRAKKALAEGRCPPQELEVGPCSGPYLLVHIKPKRLTFWNMCYFLYSIRREILRLIVACVMVIKESVCVLNMYEERDPTAVDSGPTINYSNGGKLGDNKDIFK